MPLGHIVGPRVLFGSQSRDAARRARALVLPTSLLAALPWLLGACQSKEALASYDVPKEVAAPAAPAASAAARVHWTLPEGWTPIEDSVPARYATIAVNQDSPPLLVTVSQLPKQDLLQNVNRWERQVGAAPSSAEALAKVTRQLDAGPLRVDLVDIAGSSGRLLGALIDHGGHTWVFKLTGPRDAVAAQSAQFESFIRSVRF